mgnify:CR=1 FL=1
MDAPLGAVPHPTVPSSRYTSASTVGFPLESRISLPTTFSISRYMINPLSTTFQPGLRSLYQTTTVLFTQEFLLSNSVVSID